MALFDLLAHYSIFLPEFVKFRITPGFAEFYKNLSHFDNRVIIYPEEAKLCSMVTLFTFHNSIVGNYKSNSLNLSGLSHMFPARSPHVRRTFAARSPHVRLT